MSKIIEFRWSNGEAGKEFLQSDHIITLSIEISIRVTLQPLSIMSMWFSVRTILCHA